MICDSKNKCFFKIDQIYQICVNPLTGLYVRICVDPSPAGVRCWYLLTRLYVRICVDPSPAGVRCWYPLTGLYVRICDVYM